MTTTRRIGPAVESLPLVGGHVVGDRLAVVSRYQEPTLVAFLGLEDDRDAGRLEIPHGAGSWATAVDASGGLYLGQYDAQGQTNLWRADPQRSELEGLAAIDAVTIWDLAISDGGLVVGVTTAPVTAFAYDPVAESVRALPSDGFTRLRSVSARGQRAFLGGVGDDGPRLAAIDLDDETLTVIDLGADLAGFGTVYAQHVHGDVLVAGVSAPADGSRDAVVVEVDLGRRGGVRVVPLEGVRVVDTVLRSDGVTWATTRLDGGLWRIADGAAAQVGQPVGRTEHRALGRLGGRLVGVPAVDEVWHAAADGTDVEVITLADRGVPRRPERVQSIAGGGGWVYGAGSFVIQARAADGAEVRWGRVPGEAKGMEVVDGELVAVIYPVGEVWRWGAGEPEKVAALPADQNRPLWCAHDATTGLLAVASNGDVSGRGMLHAVDLDSGAVWSTEPFTTSRGCVGVAVRDGVAFASAQGDAAPVAAWDLRTRERRWEVSPLPDGGSIVGSAVADGVLVVGSVDGWYARIDPRDGTVAETDRVVVRGEHPGGRMRAIGDTVVWATPDALLEVGPRPGAGWRVLVEPLASRYWNNPSCDVDGDEVLVLAGRDVVAVRPGAGAPVRPPG